MFRASPKGTSREIARVPYVGILALQGAVREHTRMLHACGAEAQVVKKPSQLTKIDGLIVPGGESTTIGKLMVKYDFIKAIKALFKQGVPIYGTCAGLILLAKKITEGDQPLLELMDIEARRNAFGRQKESFEADLDIPEIDKEPFRGVFIRAPWIESAGKRVKVMAYFKDKAVMAQENGLLVTAFHPELTGDIRIHQYFLNMIKVA